MPMTYTSLKTDIQTWAENTGTDFTNQLDTFIDNTQTKLSRDIDPVGFNENVNSTMVQGDRFNNKGLVKFYNQIIPKNAEKIVKKLDKNAIQKDKQVNIPNAMIKPGVTFDFPERFSIELTPQLKEKVKKGMAMFSATPLVVGQENE